MTAVPANPTNPATGKPRPNMADCVEQLTGFDELEIERNFGSVVELLVGAKYMRALAMSQELHDGVKPKAAFDKVMALTQHELAFYFADPPGREETDQEGDEDGSSAGDPDPGLEATADDRA